MNVSIPEEASAKPSYMPVELPDCFIRIAEIAYYKAENRGFESGHELDDWLDAERELLNDELNNQSN